MNTAFKSVKSELHGWKTFQSAGKTSASEDSIHDEESVSIDQWQQPLSSNLIRCRRGVGQPNADRRPAPRSGQNAHAMTDSLSVRLPLSLLGLALLLPPAAFTQVKTVPLPTQEEMRSLQLLAYSCSRENDLSSCDQTRSIADPLMDHPRLPAACKDTLWELIQASQVANANSFQRRDNIDRPARRLTVVCAKAPAPAPQEPTRT